MRKLFILFGTFIFTLSAYAEVSTKVIDLVGQESKVEFLAIGKPSLLKINGTGGKLKGKIEVSGTKVTGQLSVALDLITTGLNLRDEHMKNKYLEIAKFPEASLQISELQLEKNLFTISGSQKGVPFKGKLKIHGVEKDIEGFADVDSDEKVVSISAQTKTSISAHQIDLPSYMGIKVADEVQITTQFKLKK